MRIYEIDYDWPACEDCAGQADQCPAHHEVNLILEPGVIKPAEPLRKSACQGCGRIFLWRKPGLPE